MLKFKNYFIVFFLGIIISFIFNKIFNKKEEKLINKDYYLLQNQITKMNKMVVVEQDFSSFMTHQSSAFKLAGYDFLPKEMVLYTTAKAQVSYDLNKLTIKVDSINKKLIIEKIPEPEIKIYPDVKIHFSDDYAINRFKKDEINTIMESAKQNITNSIKNDSLKSTAKKQLFKNLDDIFVLAKALNYTTIIEEQKN